MHANINTARIYARHRECARIEIILHVYRAATIKMYKPLKLVYEVPCNALENHLSLQRYCFMCVFMRKESSVWIIHADALSAHNQARNSLYEGTGHRSTQEWPLDRRKELHPGEMARCVKKYSWRRRAVDARPKMPLPGE